ncbi:stress response protein nst1 [Moelleriella libera RCEF 2490]|uniref:Stress response protein NST1 n=1 Tax=Moelleriella libera RCEF 2490 TaxID=1081109 RepID=A0A168EI90_9HYPO|nr:stress response protein nst1 [Moelleriella libera RCEF 2490]
MPASKQKPAPLAPVSPKSTAKYHNKDGSKFITVPKPSPYDSSQPSTPAGVSKSSGSQGTPPTVDNPVAPVNRKKQKRRQKAMAKAAAMERAENGHDETAAGDHVHSELFVDDQEAVTTEDEASYDKPAVSRTENGHPDSGTKSKKTKKKKKKATSAFSNGDEATVPSSSFAQASHQGVSRSSGMSRDKIWSTSNHEERERIKEFWLGLGEEERKSLVKVEKDAVLKKMKEQQKHTCSCTVCGRKRTAIEEELEVLYDAYYNELEDFANQEGPPILPPVPSHKFIPKPVSRAVQSSIQLPPPQRGRLVEHFGMNGEMAGFEDMELYSEEEVEDDDFSDVEPPDNFDSTFSDRDVADFLTFGNSLQVKGTQLLDSLLSAYGNMDLGGILTVADDLLQNDGQKFIEMMEKLAERRMAREEDAREHFSRGHGHANNSYPDSHNHPPPPPLPAQEEDEYEEEEEDEEGFEDSQEEEYDEGEEVYSDLSIMLSKSLTECCCQDNMTEKQRMEEGRRMFQIFAARMFEQRVLSAYKEKIAKERQDKLLEELEEESRQVDEQKAKKAKSAQKKKDKAAQKKQALAEEKARKEAAKAAEETARLDAERKRLEDQKRKADEKRKSKEAQRKAEEEARSKKEADRQRRINEQREKQAELERKAREAKEREKKLKEEQRAKEKEAREEKERETLQRKEKQERDKREKEIRAAKAARESQEAAQRAREEKASQKLYAQTPQQSQPGAAPKRRQAAVAVKNPLPANPVNFASPKVPIATPAIPKAPTPIRSRTTSQQHESGLASSVASRPASTPSQGASPHSGTPAQPSPGPIGQDRKLSAGSSGIFALSTELPFSQLKSNTSTGLPPFSIPPVGMQPPPGFTQPRPPGFPSPVNQEAMTAPWPFRPGPASGSGSNMMMAPPGINGPAGTGRGYPPGPVPPPGFSHSSPDTFPMAQSFQPSNEVTLPTHTRHGSTGFDGPSGISSQPVGRPAPIGRPGSLSQGQAHNDDEDTKHLGSRVLVDDDEPLLLKQSTLRSRPPGPRGFSTSPFMEPGSFSIGQNLWGSTSGVSQHFPPPSLSNQQPWGSPPVPPGFGVGSPAPALSSMRAPSQPRHVAMRLMLCHAFKNLASAKHADSDGYIELSAIKSHIDLVCGEPNMTEIDLLELCDTEGSLSNGGGTFDVRQSGRRSGKVVIRWIPDSNDGLGPGVRAVGAPGEIGSPLPSHASFRARLSQFLTAHGESRPSLLTRLGIGSSERDRSSNSTGSAPGPRPNPMEDEDEDEDEHDLLRRPTAAELAARILREPGA